MTPLFYEVRNWGPHRHRRLDFDPSARVVALVGDNDTGKSRLVDGFGYLLSSGSNEYGDKNDILNGETASTLRYGFEDNGLNYVLEKNLGKTEKGEPKLTLNGVEIKSLEWVDFCQKAGWGHPDCFLPLSIGQQTKLGFFLKAKRGERDAVLGSMAQLGRIARWVDVLKELKKARENEYIALSSRTNHDKSAYQIRINELASEITTLEKLNLPNQERIDQAREAQTTFDRETTERSQLTLQRSHHQNSLEQNQRATARSQGELPANSTEAIDETSLRHTIRLNEANILLTEYTNLETSYDKEVSEADAQTEELNRKDEELKPIPSYEQINQWEKNYPFPTRPEADALRELQSATAINNLIENETALMTTLVNQCGKYGKNIVTWVKDGTITPEKVNALEIELVGKAKEQEDLAYNEKRLALVVPTPSEGKDLLRRYLLHWDTCPNTACPVCESEHPEWNDAKHRKTALRLLELDDEEVNRQPSVEPMANPEGMKHLEKASKAETEKTLIHNWYKNELPKIRKTLEQISAAKATLIDVDRAANQTAITKLKAETQKWEAMRELGTEFPTFVPSEQRSIRTRLETSTGVLRSQISARDTMARRRTLSQQMEDNLTKTKKLNLTDEEREEIKTKPPTTEEADNARTKLDNLSSRNSTITRVQQELSRLQGQQEEINRLIKEVDDKLTGKTPTEKITETMGELPEGFQNWNKWADWAEKKITERDRLITERQTAESKLEALQPQIELIEKQAKKLAEIDETLKLLHADNAPQKLLQNLTHKIIAKTNTWAEELQLDLTLIQDDRGNFWVEQWRDNRIIRERSDKLGWGKSTLLGICFLLGAHQLLCPKMGVIILDEPTAQVQGSRRRLFAEFLLRLKERLAAENGNSTKIILIEHNEEVIQCCDQVIEIPVNPRPPTPETK